MRQWHRPKSLTSQVEVSNQDVLKFMSKVEFFERDGCWLLKKTKTKYHDFWLKRKRYLAHRFSYFLAYGPIPKDKVIMHKCDTPRCVNPDHLAAGSISDNMRDMTAKGRRKISAKFLEKIDKCRTKTHCTNGHIFDEENTYIFIRTDGYTHRCCRACRRANSLRSYYANA